MRWRTVSYVEHIRTDSGDAWPALETMRLIDPQTFQFTGEANYLNHPPMFYALLAALGPRLEGRPQTLFALRLLDVAITALGFAALLALGPCRAFPASRILCLRGAAGLHPRTGAARRRGEQRRSRFSGRRGGDARRLAARRHRGAARGWRLRSGGHGRGRRGRS